MHTSDIAPFSRDVMREIITCCQCMTHSVSVERLMMLRRLAPCTDSSEAQQEVTEGAQKHPMSLTPMHKSHNFSSHRSSPTADLLYHKLILQEEVSHECEKFPPTTEATKAHFFVQESNSTHRIWVRFQLNSCGNELKSCASNSIPAQKSEPLWLPYLQYNIKVSVIKFAICEITIWMTPYSTYLERTFITNFFCGLLPSRHTSLALAHWEHGGDRLKKKIRPRKFIRSKTLGCLNCKYANCIFICQLLYCSSIFVPQQVAHV